MWKYIFFFLLLIFKTVRSDVYDQASLYDCKKNQDYSEQQRMQILELYPTDAYMFVIIGPISFSASLFIIIIFILFPSARQIPGDILLGLSFCNALQSIHYIMSGWYYLIHKNSPEPSSPFCQTSGAFAVFASTGAYLYNLAFVISPLILINNTLTQNKYFQFIIPYQLRSTHLATLFTMLLLVTYSLVSDNISIDLSGQCTLAQEVYEGKNLYFFSMLLVLYVFISIFALKEFKKAIPKNETLSSMRKIFISYYQKIVIVTAIMWGFEIILAWIIELNCYVFQKPKLNISITLFNTSCVLIPIFQSYIRSQDPVLRSKIRKTYKKIFTSTQSIQTLDLDQSRKISEIELQNSETQDEKSILEEIQQQLKRTQVYTILAGIQLMIQQQRGKNLRYAACNLAEEEEQMNKIMLDIYQNKLSRNRPRQQTRLQIEAKLKHIQEINKSFFSLNSFSLDQANEKAEIILKDYHDFSVPSEETQISIFYSKVTYYGPKIFEYLQQQDQQMVDLLESFDLRKNKEKVQSFSAGPDGGKSGEFFFFSWNNKMILKTMKWDEVLALRQRLQMYGNYLKNNPDSLISKIYGIFSFQRLDIEQQESKQIHILIMRNISLGVPRQYILRTYDMKGSEFDREVLKKKNENVELNRITLKDTDFLKLEEKMWIQGKLAEICADSLKSDANFFKQAGLIDYSLLVFKIDWESYFSETNATYQQTRSKLNNGLYMLESTKEKGVYYHIAIIDYLQEWNVEKQSEQLTKKIIQMNASLDTSSQNPQIYAERFKTKLIERIFRVNDDPLSLSQVQQDEINKLSNSQFTNIEAIKIDNQQL